MPMRASSTAKVGHMAARCLLSCLALWPWGTAAAPDLSQTADFSVLHAAPTHGYRFHTLPFTSADSLRNYRVYVGIPDAPPPAHGYPVLYALDGNALLGQLTPQRLQQLNRQAPAMLVLIGHATDLRFDVVARSWDYTPVTADGQTITDALHPERRNGGAEAFLNLLQQHIRPAVAKLAPLNPRQQTLWGHSYGGLLVLYTLLTRPYAFQQYIAADPSLWWHNGDLLHRLRAFAATPPALAPVRLQLQHSGQPSPQPAATDDALSRRRQQALRHTDNQTLSRLATQLAAVPQLQVQYRHYPQYHHGQLLGASFLAALDGLTILQSRQP